MIMWLGIANGWEVAVFGILADAYAITQFWYVTRLLKLLRDKSTPRSDTNDGPHSDVSLVRIEAEAVHRTACRGLLVAVFALLLNADALTKWATAKNPLSTLEIMLAVSNILMCLFLVAFTVWLERVRRLYRRFARAAFVVAR